jgi:hypothetical protein
MISTGQLAAALYGVWLLLKLDARCLAFFDKTPGGFARSFLPALILAPLHFIDAGLAYNKTETSLGFAPYMIVQFIAYVLSWVTFPFVMIYVARLLGREARYLAYMVPYNWFQLLVGGVLLPVMLLTDLNLLPVDAAGFLQLIALLMFFTFGTFIARVGLYVGLTAAIGVVVLDFTLSLLLNQIVARI